MSEKITIDPDKTIVPSSDTHTKINSNILRRKSLNTLTNFPKLSTQPSKLDLIDDTTLTSLPLPPPPPIKKVRDSISSGRKDSTSIHTLDSLISHATTTIDQPVDVTHEIDEDFDDTTNYYDDTFDEYEDPIILIEDYVDGSGDKFIEKKKSLANFKQKIFNKSMIQFNQYLSNEKSTNSNLKNWEDIFGKIPGGDKLKYCDICEKPLYEISSIINNNSMNKLAQKKLRQLYTEFICWDCIEIYEQFFNEFQWQDDDESSSTTLSKSISLPKINNLSISSFNFNDEGNKNKHDNLINVFKSIQEKYINEIDQPLTKRSRNNSNFSDNLMNQLHNLNDSANDDRTRFHKIIDESWITNLQYKLRWRWRLNGLVPGSTSNN